MATQEKHVTLTKQQVAEIERLASRGKSGPLNDLADRWGVPVRLVARAYADARRAQRGESATPAKPGQEDPQLTYDQLCTVNRLAAEGKSGKLVELASNWGVPPSVLVRQYSKARHAAMLEVVEIPPDPALVPAPVLTPKPPPAPAEESPVAHVTAEPGEIGTVPRPWRMIQARTESGRSVKQIALAVGLTSAAINRIEAGAQLPTPDEAAKICALLRIPIEETFTVAGHQTQQRGSIRGLSLLGLIRARRRLTIKAFCLQAAESTRRHISQTLVSRIERNVAKRLRPDEFVQVAALATYLQIPQEWVTAQVPPEWMSTMAVRTAQLHQAFKQAHAALPAAPTDPLLLINGSGEVAE